MYIIIFTTEVDWKDTKKALVCLRERQAGSPLQQSFASLLQQTAAFSPQGHLEGHRKQVSTLLVLLKNNSGTVP